MISETARIYTDKIGMHLEIRDYAIVYQNAELMDNVLIGEHSVIGRIPTATSAMVREVSKLALPTIIGHGTTLCSNVIIYNDVIIGSDCLIGDNSSVFTNVIIGDRVLISRNVTINSEVNIGNNTRIMDNSHVTGRVKIGENVFISVGVVMANDNFFGKFGYNENVSGATIEDFVSIGVGAVILPNVRIGKGSIIAAGSVVKNDVPENVIYGGNPGAILTRVPKHMRRY